MTDSTPRELRPTELWPLNEPQIQAWIEFRNSIIPRKVYAAQIPCYCFCWNGTSKKSWKRQRYSLLTGLNCISCAIKSRTSNWNVPLFFHCFLVELSLLCMPSSHSLVWLVYIGSLAFRLDIFTLLNFRYSGSLSQSFNSCTAWRHRKTENLGTYLMYLLYTLCCLIQKLSNVKMYNLLFQPNTLQKIMCKFTQKHR